MGRRKITIKQISDPKLRHITFNKRKNGLIKKAAELSVLCNVPMLLVFEDSNGNLIQFTRNNINSIPEFFQTLRYNNVLEFNASQYPTFFKVNHYKKHKDREMDDQYSQDDDMDYGEEDDMKSPVYVEESPEYRPTKKVRTQNVKEEDRNLIYQSASEQEDNGEMEPMNDYNEEEAKPLPLVQEKPRSFQRVRASSKPEEKVQQQKVFISEEQEMEMAQMDEPEMPMARKESFQSFREVSRVRIEKNVEYQQPQFNGFENSFKRTSQNNDQNNSFRYYPSDNNNNMNNGNMQRNNNNNFNNVAKLPNKNQFLNNNVNNNNTNMNMIPANNMNQNFGQNQMQRNSNNQHGYKRATHFNSHKAQILRGFANMGMNNMQNMGGMVNMNMGNMQNLNGMGNLNAMNGINNMGNISNEETLNAMLKGLPSLGFMGQANSFMAKGGNKAEMDEKLLDTANMIKYLNSTNATSYPGSKMYNFQNSDNNKNDETDNMYNLRNRNEGENGNYDNESEFNDQQQYMRGEFRLENNLPSNLPSAYFSSKKFNFDGYFSNFEEDKFNEFGDPKKKQSKIN